MDAFLGTILPVAFNFAPRGWALCDGSLLSIQQNTALFALIGNAYGGDGRTTFGVPDLRGNVPGGAVLSSPTAPVMPLSMGQKTGAAMANASASATLTLANLPAHAHEVAIASNQLKATSTFNVTATAGGATPAAGSAIGTGGSGGGAANIYVPNVTPDIALNASSVKTTLDAVTVTSASAGSASPTPLNLAATLSTLQPTLGVNFIICVEGIFPQRP